MEQANHLDDLASLPIDHEVPWVGDASCRGADLIAARSQVQCAETKAKIAAVVRSGNFRVAGDAGERCHHERLIAVSDRCTKTEHRPFKDVVDVCLGVFTEVELECHALFAAARSVARRPRSLR